MKLWCPFTIVHLPTVALVAAMGGEMVPVDAWDGYLSFLEQRWAEGQAFVVVEHDVDASSAQVRALMECPAPWCGYGAVQPDGNRRGEGGSVSLCLTKFAPPFMALTASVWADLRAFTAGEFRTGDGRWWWDGHQPPWQLVDAWLVWWLEHFAIALSPHKHLPAVVNARPHHQAVPA